jgi:hypothetical protein
MIATAIRPYKTDCIEIPKDCAGTSIKKECDEFLLLKNKH